MIREAISHFGAPYEYEVGGETLVESMSAGLRRFPSAPAVLVASADLPLITAEAVEDFLIASSNIQMDFDHNLYVSVVSRECYTGPYTRFTKPFNQFRNISVCHGNLFIADPELINNHAAVEHINRLYQGRKTAVTSALALGLETALAYLVGVECLHLIKLRQMSEFASRHFGFGIVPVVIGHPEITIDVDEPEDYDFVRGLLDKPQESVSTCASR